MELQERINVLIQGVELAQKAGITMEALRNIRKGKSIPKPATVGKIARALNVNVQEIIMED